MVPILVVPFSPDWRQFYVVVVSAAATTRFTDASSASLVLLEYLELHPKNRSSVSHFLKQVMLRSDTVRVLNIWVHEVIHETQGRFWLVETDS